MLLKTTNVYNRIKDVDARIICLRGGTRSSKSFSMIQLLTVWLFTGRIGGRQVNTGTFSVTRSTLPALKATVYKELLNYLFELGIYQYIDHKKTTLELAFNGREIVFFSLDDSHKLRGRQHTFLWYNEVTDIDFETWNQGAMRTTHSIYNDYNPSGNPWIRTEIEEDRMPNRGDVYLDVSVYTDNPFLPERLIKEIEGLEHVDNDLWRIYTKGEWVKLTGLIYPNVKMIDEIPLTGKVYYGLDFGWNDPSVLVKVVVDGDNLYVDTLVHESELGLDEMAKKIKAVTKQGDKIFCDYAEPRTIEELKRRGINSVKSKPKDVFRSITWIKQHNIHLTSTSFQTKKEWEMFKWDTDKENRLIDKPVNFAKHSSDAMSYAIGQAMRGGTRIL